MTNLPTKPNMYSGPLLVIALCSLLFFAEPYSSQYLAYFRADIAAAQYWRLLSANFLHTNDYHLWLNCAGIALLWGLHGQYYRFSRYILLLSLSGLVACIGVHLLSPHLQHYVGLSGAIHGLFLWGAWQDVQHGLKSGWLLIGGVLLKVAYEQWSGGSEEVAALIDATVAIDAHLFGLLAGVLACFIWRTPHGSKPK